MTYPPSCLGPDADRLLASRHVLSTTDAAFVRNDHYDRLYNKEAAGPEKPAVLFTACPHDLGGSSAGAAGGLADWAKRTEHIEVEGHQIPVLESEQRSGAGTLTTTCRYPGAPPDDNILTYREFNDTGLFEYGTSYLYLGSNRRRGLSLHLCYMIGDFWGFLHHARLFYGEIGMDRQPFTVLLSVRNSSALTLGNYGDEMAGRNWRLPGGTAPSSDESGTVLPHVQLSYTFGSARGMADREAARTARDAAQGICNAYSQSTPRCYDKSGCFAWRLWEEIAHWRR